MKAKLALLLIVSIFLISYATARDVCCEKLTNSDDYCVHTDEENCDTSYRKAAVSCELASFCNPGCCYSSNDGECHKNVASAECRSIERTTWAESEACDIPQCQKGCCLMGSQGFYVTEVKCKLETSKYGNVTMQWDPEITSEPECQAKARSQDMGCCVSADTCTFTTRENCETAAVTPTVESPTEQEETLEETVGIRTRQEGFYKDMLCSNDRLSCGCAKQINTGCYDDKVYWFDSCGNRENVYSADKDKSYNQGYVLGADSICSSPALLSQSCGNCDYGQGSICRSTSALGSSLRSAYGNFICSKTSCDSIYDDKISPSAGEAKKNGESWCLYDSQVGEAKDLVGSRHYRHLCINGEELTEPCMDYREEICVQGVMHAEPTTTYRAFRATGDYIEAACRDNRWEDCFDCNTVAAGCGAECSGLSESEDIQMCCAQKCCENMAYRDCYWLGTQGDWGYCVPEVPPGLQFWPSETAELPTSTTRSSAATTAAVTTGDAGAFGGGATPNSNAESVCSEGNQECKVIWYIGGTGRLGIGGIGTETEYECVENCHCTKPGWVISGNNLCKALGDCGAYFNILGKSTMDGYANTASSERKGDKNLYFDGYTLKPNDIGDWRALRTRPAEPKDFDMDMGDYIDKFGVPLAFFIFSGFVSTAGGGEFLAGATGGLSLMATAIGSLSLKAAGKEATGLYGKSFAQGTAVPDGATFSTETIKQTYGTTNPTDLGFKGFEQTGETWTCRGGCGNAPVDMTSSSGNLMGAVNTIMWLYTIYQLVEVFYADTEEQTYTISCSPWQAPTGGNDCEKCNEDPQKPCSIYKCKSLGQNCYLVNQGTSEEECVNLNPNDVNSPVIEPLEEAIPEDYTITATTIEGNKGYKINEKIGPYDSITLGIKTDEPAQCKFTDKVGTDFDEMTIYFGNSQYLYEQQITFTIPAEFTTREALRSIGDTYNLYIRCKDASGNKNEKDYFIRFTLKPEPDMTSPTIEKTSIEEGAYIQSDITETDFSIYVDERATCKYSTTDKEYELMEEDFECLTSPFTVNSVFNGLYECKTKLDLNITELKWFIRCKDTGGNKNEESYKFSLAATEPLEITSIGPTGTFYESEVTLNAVTSGGAENGKAKCAYSTVEDEALSNMVMFLNTDATIHEQPEYAPGIGEFTIYVKCIDIAANVASDSTTFTLDVDLEGPEILYIYVTPLDYLHIEMDEESTCEYSSETFTFGTGNPMTGTGTTIHQLSITEKIYHIICQDAYFNEASFTVYP